MHSESAGYRSGHGIDFAFSGPVTEMEVQSPA
jgi:hypothetical protein